MEDIRTSSGKCICRVFFIIYMRESLDFSRLEPNYWYKVYFRLNGCILKPFCNIIFIYCISLLWCDLYILANILYKFIPFNQWAIWIVIPIEHVGIWVFLILRFHIHHVFSEQIVNSINGYCSRRLNINKQVCGLRCIYCHKTICTISFSTFEGVSDFIIHPIVVIPHPILSVINR